MPADERTPPANEQAEPWERQPRESLKAFAAFRAYLEAGPQRSHRGLAQQLGKSGSLISRWANAHGWTVRIAAWDEFQARQHKASTVEVIAARTERQAEISRLHLEALALPARELLRRLHQNPDLLANLPLQQLMHVNAQAARALKNVVVTERLALGISTENIDHAGGPQTPARERAAAMTDDDLEALMLGASIDAYRLGREDAAKENSDA
jgi:hypothetical protein